MTASRAFVARLIEQGSRGLASLACAELSQRFQRETAASSGWREWFLARISDLSVAIECGIPRLFATQIGWSISLFTARELTENPANEAVAILKEILRNELPEVARPLIDACFEDIDGGPQISPPDCAKHQGCADFVAAILSGSQAEAITIATAQDGYDIVSCYEELLVPAMTHIGNLWQVGEISVADEHFATATARLAMAELVSRAEKSLPNGKTVVLAAVSGNLHDLGLQMLADAFSVSGWQSICLGADMPIPDLVAAVASYGADAVLLSAALLPHLTVARDTVAALKSAEETKNVRVLVGGRAFALAPELAIEFGADGYSGGIGDAVAKVSAAVKP